MTRRRSKLAGAVAMVLLAADGGAAAPLAHLAGDWGGIQARLVMRGDGGQLDLSCAAARIDPPLRATRDGGFTANGHYEEFSAGATPADTAPVTVAARFKASVAGDTMQLSMHVVGAKEAQIFALARGRRVKLIRCL